MGGESDQQTEVTHEFTHGREREERERERERGKERVRKRERENKDKSFTIVRSPNAQGIIGRKRKREFIINYVMVIYKRLINSGLHKRKEWGCC